MEKMELSEALKANASVLEELKCYFNVLLYRNNLAKLILEYSSE